MKDRENNAFCDSCKEQCGAKSKEALNCELLMELADFFKNFADATRMKILTALDKEAIIAAFQNAKLIEE